MASDDTPVRFMTGCPTGFGRELAKAVLELACRKLDELRENGHLREDATLGADRPEHRKG